VKEIGGWAATWARLCRACAERPGEKIRRAEKELNHPLIVNLRHLEKNDVVLRGELPVDELKLDTRDEMIGVTQPLRHELEVQLLERSLLVRGSLRLMLECRCVRC